MVKNLKNKIPGTPVKKKRIGCRILEECEVFRVSGDGKRIREESNLITKEEAYEELEKEQEQLIPEEVLNSIMADEGTPEIGTLPPAIMEGNTPAIERGNTPAIERENSPGTERNAGEREDTPGMLEETPEQAIIRLTQGKKTTGRYSVVECIDAFVRGEGYISRAARILGVTTKAFEKYVNGYKLLRELVVDYQTARLDEAERKLFKAVKKGDIQAIKYYLNTQGQLRGYSPGNEKGGPKGKSPEQAQKKKGKLVINTYLEFAKFVLQENEKEIVVNPKEKKGVKWNGTERRK